ncbi:MAG: hypothetical protein FWD45_05725 [Coriobacteriia bacterium]|nr:hypothetical protein [Coriobacteriia bacterium]
MLYNQPYFLSHQTAIQFWRIHAESKKPFAYSQCFRKLPDSKPDTPSSQVGDGDPVNMLQHESLKGLTAPFHIMVGSKSARQKSRSEVQALLHYHVHSGSTPRGSFLYADNQQSVLTVSSPEFCFFQMASEMSLIELIEFGYELCGTYSLAAFDCVPLTSLKQLQTFVSRMKGEKGYKKATRALRFITDGSASPMETKLTLLLTLPNALGGYNLPIPELNSRIAQTKTAARIADRSYYSCDLFWADAGLAVEYDSDSFHTGAERIARDASRRNALAAIGVQVITVTNRQLRDVEQFERIVIQIAKNTKHRLSHDKPEFKACRRDLRIQLLNPDSTTN